jgi:hypothetical protein
MSDENNPGPLNAYDKLAWPTPLTNDPEAPKPFKADYSLLAGQVAASIADGTFKREERYIVTKIKTSNNKVGSIPIKTHQRVEAVVVEKDWPEYEVVWGMIQDRVEGRPNCIERLEADLFTAAERERALQHENENLRAECMSMAMQATPQSSEAESMDPITRFDLEQAILGCWNITSDLDVLMEGVLEKDMTPDDISNVLIGLKTLYDMRFDSCFNKFEKLISKGVIK